MDTEFLNIDTDQISRILGMWTVFLLVEIVCSYIVDVYIGQRKSVAVSGIISGIGYLLLIIQSKASLIIALVCILLGTSLAKPSTTILIGRQFHKADKNRTLAYIVFFACINIGAFLGVVSIGYIGENNNWSLCFCIAAISAFLYSTIAFFCRNYIKEIETNEDLLPTYTTTKNSILSTLPSLTALLLLYVVFWNSYNIELGALQTKISKASDRFIFDFEVLRSIRQELPTLCSMVLTILVFMYWRIKGVTNIIRSSIFSILLITIAIAVSQLIEYVPSDYNLEIALVPITMFALAQVIMSPLLISYLTRISDIKYSNTIYSVFMFLVHGIGLGVVHLTKNEFRSYLIVGALGLTTLTLILYKQTKTPPDQKLK